MDEDAVCGNDVPVRCTGSKKPPQHTSIFLVFDDEDFARLKLTLLCGYCNPFGNRYRCLVSFT
jgi:uncharacterized Zn-finger protein